MPNNTNRQVAALLRQIADAIERGESIAFDAMGPAFAALYERRQLIQPTPAPAKPKAPEAPTVFYENGNPRPLSIKRRVELADTKSHTYITWPHNWQQLAKFARMPETKRDFWSGKTKIYGEALRLFSRYGFIERRGNGWQWSRDFTPLQRREFAQQFRPSIPHSPNA